MLEVLAAIPKLVDRGIELLRERDKQGEKQKAAFLKEVAEPLHSIVETMYRDHLATVETVRKMIKDGRSTGKQICEFANERRVLEYGVVTRLVEHTWIDSNDDWRRIPGEKGDLGMLFRTYVYKVATSLIDAFERERPPTLAWYANLERLAGGLAAAFGDFPPDIGAQDRGEEELDDLITRFHRYFADVEKAYMLLRRECTA